jgi:hypothetical protein
MPPQDTAAPDACRPAPLRFAPELPAKVLHAILLPLAGDIATLCAAACVSTSWNCQALHPRLWKKLELHPPLYATATGAETSCQSTKPQYLTDERLAMLVRRACGLDADGNEHKLLSLRATHSTEVPGGTYTVHFTGKVPPTEQLPVSGYAPGGGESTAAGIATRHARGLHRFTLCRRGKQTAQTAPLRPRVARALGRRGLR